MSRALEIVPLAPQYVPPLTAFFQALQQNGDEAFFHPHPLTAEHAELLCSLGTADIYVIAIHGDDILSYGMLRGWADGWDIPSLGIATHPRYRGTGASLAMMHFLHLAARLRQAAKIRLTVTKGNLRARKLYAQLGYTFQDHTDDTDLGFLTL